MSACLSFALFVLSVSVDTLTCLRLSPQLLGFIYACYVISVITEEEDSCEYLLSSPIVPVCLVGSSSAGVEG